MSGILCRIASLDFSIGCTEKTFNTEAQSARRKKNADLERNFSVNYHYFLRVLRVSVVK